MQLQWMIELPSLRETKWLIQVHCCQRTVACQVPLTTAFTNGKRAQEAGPHCFENQPCAVKTTNAAITSINVVIGAQRRLSGFDGVIQLSKVTTAWRVKAAHAVQSGQSGQKPPADPIARALPAIRKTETPAKIRFFAGSAPSC